MDGVKERWAGLMRKLGKFRYPLLILALGLVLLLIPGKSGTSQQAPEPTEMQAPDLGVEAQLEQMLEAIEGAGRVEVMLTVRAGEETLYQTDPGSDGSSAKTVLRNAGSSQEEALVRQVLGPEYQGALVVCQGADNAQVRLRIVEAVAAVTGLRSDQISVVKMK